MRFDLLNAYTEATSIEAKNAMSVYLICHSVRIPKAVYDNIDSAISIIPSTMKSMDLVFS
ncbi:MAG: hypothetical protein ACP5HF_02775 [Candidatus Micrarchaeia archaeon]